MVKRSIFLTAILFGLIVWSCEDLEDCAGVVGGDSVCGCTDSTAANYDITATFDDGSCEDCAGVVDGISICGCMDSTATNYDSTASFDDGSCEYDTAPPTVIITTTFSGSVYEIVAISVMVSDDVGIMKTELWIDGVATGVTDDTEPYLLLWNTTSYNDSTDYVIVIRAYDTSGNTTDSDPLTLTVDNSLAVPSSVQLYPVTYQDDTFMISWSQNNDDDLLSYNLYESMSEEPSGMELIYTTNTRDDTTFTVTGISPGEERYYQVTVSDTLGLTSNSNIESGIGSLISLWANTYDYMGYSDWGNSVIEVSDGYWALGVMNGQKRLMKTDLEGNLILDRYDLGYGYGNQILESSDGSLYVFGGSNFPNSGDYQMTIQKLDNGGNVIWGSYFDDDSWGYGGLLSQNDETIIYGEKDGYGVVYTHSDSLEWELVVSDESMDRVKGMVEIENGGGYYIAFSKDYETKIIKTDNSFSEVEDITIPGYCRSISLAGDGNLLITLQMGENEHKVAKLDPSTGQDIWAETATGLYNSFQLGTNYFALGHSESGALFLKLDEDGSVITSTTFGSGILSGYSLTSDGGIIITGTTSYWNDEQSDTPLYKTNLSGELGATFSLVQGSGQLLRMDNSRDSNLIPVQINKKQSD